MNSFNSFLAVWITDTNGARTLPRVARDDVFVTVNNAYRNIVTVYVAS